MLEGRERHASSADSLPAAVDASAAEPCDRGVGARAAEGGPGDPLILHVIHHLRMGGMENGLINLIDGLRQRPFRHAVLCVEDYSDFRDRLRSERVEVMALHRSRVGVWRMRRKIYDLCRRLRPAIVHSRNLSGLDALLPARLAGVRACVHGEHGWDVHDLHGEHWRPALLRRLHSPLVDRYVVVSRHLERYLVSRVGISASRIEQVYNGVDTTRFAPRDSKPLEILPPRLRGESLFVVGTVGRAQPVKDQLTLLRSVAELAKSDADLRRRLRLAIVGDGPLLAQLQSAAGALGVADIAWFPRSLDDVPSVLRLFDVFALPSLAEGISNTILEAMATGLPIVATRVGGNPEIVDERSWGRLFAPGDVEALTSLLHAYARQPELRHAHAEAARRAAVTQFSLSTMVGRYEATYADLLYRRTQRVGV